MRRILKIAAIVVAVVVAVLALIVGGVLAYYSWRSIETAPIDGPAAIAELAAVTINGSEQHILVRGADRKAPILLYLHAGPGMAAMSYADTFSRELEKHFVVVQWDQRGAGKSCHTALTPGKPFLDEIAEDAAALLVVLRERIGPNPVFLVGHATGAAVAAVVAHRHPELVQGVVMVAPLVDTVANETKVLEWLRARAAESGQSDLSDSLKGLSVPYANPEDFLRVHDAVAEHGGATTNPSGILPVIAHGLQASEYSLHEKLSYVRCIEDSMAAAYDSLWTVKLSESVPSLAMPVWILIGGKDRSIDAGVVRRYHDALQAPAKEMVVLEEAAHYPMFEQPERFNRELITRLLRK